MPLAGQIIRALDFTAAVTDTETTSGTTNSTSYTATLTGGTACEVVFVAPTSGKVLVLNACQYASSGTDQGHCSFQINTGTSPGSGFLAAADSRAVRFVAAAVGGRQEVHVLVTGLTPGSSYNAQQMFRVSGGTGTFANKTLSVIPLPA